MAAENSRTKYTGLLLTNIIRMSSAKRGVITFVTGNEMKRSEVAAILGDEIPIVARNVDCMTLQSSITHF